MAELIKSFLAQSDAKATRATVMGPIGWLLALLVGALVTTAVWGPTWLQIALAVGVAVVCFFFVRVYLYLVKNNPDALRSETYLIKKMEMQVGDSKAGLRKIRVKEGHKPHGELWSQQTPKGLGQ